MALIKGLPSIPSRLMVCTALQARSVCQTTPLNMHVKDEGVAVYPPEGDPGTTEEPQPINKYLAEEEERQGLKFDEKPDTRKMLMSMGCFEVVNENRVRPRVFFKIGKSTLEDPGGYMTPHGSSDPTIETIKMTQSIREFFRRRQPPPQQEMPTRFIPGKLNDDDIRSLKAMEATKARRPQTEVQTEIKQIPPPASLTLSKLQYLQREKKAKRSNAPPPRADIRKNFRPLPRR